MLELPVDPYNGIPRRVAEVLDRFIIPAAYEAATDAQDALELLLASWGGLEDPDAIERWVALHGGKSWVAARDSTGRLEESQSSTFDLESGSAIVIPSQVISTLQTVLEVANADERFIGVDSLDMIVLQTRAVYIDDEKLLGHLVITHGVPLADIGRTDDERLAQHSAIHWRVPGHGTWAEDV
jgi:hypothetical protein